MQVTSNLLTYPTRNSKLDSGERQRAVSYNALHHNAIMEGPRYFLKRSNSHAKGTTAWFLWGNACLYWTVNFPNINFKCSVDATWPPFLLSHCWGIWFLLFHIGIQKKQDCRALLSMFTDVYWLLLLSDGKRPAAKKCKLSGKITVATYLIIPYF